MGTRERIALAFKEALAIEVPSFDTDIIAAGLLDSLMLVTLLVELEARFGLTIPLEAIDIERLRTVNSIAAFVEEMETGERHDASPSTAVHQ
jgi:acyl carrier protein